MATWSSKAPPDEEEPKKKGESTQDKVRQWRFNRLLDAGYDIDTAMIFAETKDDLHKLCDWKLAGLTDELAIDLLT